VNQKCLLVIFSVISVKYAEIANVLRLLSDIFGVMFVILFGHIRVHYSDQMEYGHNIICYRAKTSHTATRPRVQGELLPHTYYQYYVSYNLTLTVKFTIMLLIW